MHGRNRQNRFIGFDSQIVTNTLNIKHMKQFILGFVYLASLLSGIFLLQMGSYASLLMFLITGITMKLGVNYIHTETAKKSIDNSKH